MNLDELVSESELTEKDVEEIAASINESARKQIDDCL